MASNVQTQNKLDTFIDRQYQPLNANFKVFILIVALVLPAVLMYFLVYKPNNEEKLRLNKQIEAVQKDIDKAKDYIAKEAQYKAELADIRLKFNERLKQLPQEQEIPDLLRNISDLGKSAGLEFLSFVPGQEVQKEFYADIPINIKVYGPYHSVGLFLDKLSKLDRIVNVDNLAMASPKQENGEMLLTSTGKLLTYRFIDKPAAPTQSAPTKKK